MHSIAPKLALLAATCALASTASAQVFSYDDGDTENAMTYAGIAEIAFIHRFDAGPAGATITEIRAAVGSALAPAGQLDGNTMTLAIWDHPSNVTWFDAVLLYQSPPLLVTQSNTDIKQSYPIPPTHVTGLFYVGVVTQAMTGTFPVGEDQSGYDPSETAYVVASYNSMDIVNIANNSIGPFLQSHVHLLDAVASGGPVGQTYCGPGAINSSGGSGELSAVGSTQVQANALELLASGLPANQFGYFLTSQTQGLVVMPGGSQGNLCLGGSIGRFVNQIQSTGPGGTLGLSVDLTQVPQPGGLVAIAPGETWNFQAWHRDANPGPTSNFTEGLSIAFL